MSGTISLRLKGGFTALSAAAGRVEQEDYARYKEQNAASKTQPVTGANVRDSVENRTANKEDPANARMRKRTGHGIAATECETAGRRWRS